MGAIGLAGREKLDNLIFVVNCNLQRLDGPVRGNGKIIQELESRFRGAGWNVIKVDLGRHWDPLLAQRQERRAARRMMEVVDGEYQTYKSKNGAFVREHFFNTPELKDMVAELSDDDIWLLNRGGHDPFKVYAAYHAAVNAQGPADRDPREDDQGLRHGRGRRGDEHRPPAEEDRGGRDPPLPRPLRPAGPGRPARGACRTSSSRRARRSSSTCARGARSSAATGRSARRHAPRRSPVPPLAAFERLLKSTEDREISTTMALRADPAASCSATRSSASASCQSSRTRRARSAWRGCSGSSGSGASVGQLYTPEDAAQLVFYREDKNGQVLQEGITEAGAMASGSRRRPPTRSTAMPMIPFYIFYSMFGFQRVGDFAWAAGDMRCRGFLLGGTPGRTTLNGEGLQHEDGHSHVLVGGDPELPRRTTRRSRYEVAVIVQDGLRRMVRGAGGRLLLPDGAERELRAPGHAGGRGARTS